MKDYVKIRKNLSISIIIVTIIFTIFLFYYYINYKKEFFYEMFQKNFERTYQIIDYDLENNSMTVEINAKNLEMYCGVYVNDMYVSYNIEKNKCKIQLPIEKHTIYFKYKDYDSDSFEINNIIFTNDIKEKYYLATTDTIDLNNNIYKIGEQDIEWILDNDNIEIKDNVITPLNKGNTHIIGKYNNQDFTEFDITTTNVITVMPTSFNYNKKHLTCGVYNEEDNNVADEILEYRINNVGYQTRAAAVEAARFLTLSFPYRISYFYENGRVHKTGTNYVDGEGRYYKKGLFLDKSRYKDLRGRLVGPATWGCGLKSFQPDEPRFIPGNKYPNGLDCSGFVTWTLINAGFDPGDIGAHDAAEIADKRRLTKDLMDSGEIKVGDLFHLKGHISILIGMYDDKYIIAESLPELGGVVAKEYTKKNVTKYFSHVVLMDSFYGKDGNITNLWY